MRVSLAACCCFRGHPVCPARSRCGGARLDDRVVRSRVWLPLHRARIPAEEIQTNGLSRPDSLVVNRQGELLYSERHAMPPELGIDIGKNSTL
jgi:hypothetical protein